MQLSVCPSILLCLSPCIQRSHDLNCTSLVRMLTQSSLKLCSLLSNGSRTLSPSAFKMLDSRLPRGPVICQTSKYNCLEVLPKHPHPSLHQFTPGHYLGFVAGLLHIAIGYQSHLPTQSLPSNPQQHPLSGNLRTSAGFHIVWLLLRPGQHLLGKSFT